MLRGRSLPTATVSKGRLRSWVSNRSSPTSASGIMLADKQNVPHYVAASDGPETLGMGKVHPWDRIEPRGQHFNETRRLGRRTAATRRCVAGCSLWPSLAKIELRLSLDGRRTGRLLAPTCALP
jgi:hypothetical protein